MKLKTAKEVCRIVKRKPNQLLKEYAQRIIQDIENQGGSVIYSSHCPESRLFHNRQTFKQVYHIIHAPNLSIEHISYINNFHTFRPILERLGFKLDISNSREIVEYTNVAKEIKVPIKKFLGFTIEKERVKCEYEFVPILGDVTHIKISACCSNKDDVNGKKRKSDKK